MNIAQLAQTIRDDASRQAAEYERETQDMVARIEEETSALIARKREELKRAVFLKAEAQRARLTAQAEIEMRMRTLQQRKEVLDAVFARAAKELGALTGAKRTRLLTRLWAKTGMHSPTVIVAKKDAPFFTKRAHITQRVPGLGGFIAVSEDGKERVDLRFETLLDDARPRITPDVARILWGNTSPRPARKATKRVKTRMMTGKAKPSPARKPTRRKTLAKKPSRRKR